MNSAGWISLIVIAAIIISLVLVVLKKSKDEIAGVVVVIALFSRVLPLIFLIVGSVFLIVSLYTNDTSLTIVSAIIIALGIITPILWIILEKTEEKDNEKKSKEIIDKFKDYRNQKELTYAFENKNVITIFTNYFDNSIEKEKDEFEKIIKKENEHVRVLFLKGKVEIIKLKTP